MKSVVIRFSIVVLAIMLLSPLIHEFGHAIPLWITGHQVEFGANGEGMHVRSHGGYGATWFSAVVILAPFGLSAFSIFFIPKLWGWTKKESLIATGIFGGFIGLVYLNLVYLVGGIFLGGDPQTAAHTLSIPVWQLSLGMVFLHALIAIVIFIRSRRPSHHSEWIKQLELTG